MKTVTFENGNKMVTATLVSTSVWEKGSMKREYFNLSFDKGRMPISKLYRIDAGSTRDFTFEVDGKKYGIDFGVDCNSNAKQEHVLEAAKELVRSQKKVEMKAVIAKTSDERVKVRLSELSQNADLYMTNLGGEKIGAFYIFNGFDDLYDIRSSLKDEGYTIENITCY